MQINHFGGASHARGIHVPRHDHVVVLRTASLTDRPHPHRSRSRTLTTATSPTVQFSLSWLEQHLQVESTESDLLNAPQDHLQVHAAPAHEIATDLLMFVVFSTIRTSCWEASASVRRLRIDRFPEFFATSSLAFWCASLSSCSLLFHSPTLMKPFFAYSQAAAKGKLSCGLPSAALPYPSVAAQLLCPPWKCSCVWFHSTPPQRLPLSLEKMKSEIKRERLRIHY